MFDPSTSYININWTLILIPIFLLPTHYYINNNSPLFIINIINNEINPDNNLNSNNNFILPIILTFITILTLNILSLSPYLFSITSHFFINLNLTLTAWITIILYQINTNINTLIIHTLPNSTPYALISFIILIEIVSNLIRPLTLAIRLTANIIAGHLLISLLSNLIITNINIIIISFLPIILSTLETAVSIIQAYVLTILLSLYTTEIN